MNTALFNGKLQLVHLFDVFRCNRLKPRQTRSPTTAVGLLKSLWDRQIFFEPAVCFSDHTQCPWRRIIAVSSFFQCLEQTKTLALAFDQAKANEPDIDATILLHRPDLALIRSTCEHDAATAEIHPVFAVTAAFSPAEKRTGRKRPINGRCFFLTGIRLLMQSSVESESLLAAHRVVAVSANRVKNDIPAVA